MAAVSKSKYFLNPLVKFVVQHKLTWKIVSFFLRIGEWFRYERSLCEHEVAEMGLKLYFQNKEVQNGFFKGMKYASFNSAGSSLFPKLLGSYEIELYPKLVELQDNNYDAILDIGCAEGYYAVGLALKFPGAKVHAYDIDKNALLLCEALARHNLVLERVFLHEACSSSTLEDFEYSGKTLVICDCEGYEKELFTTKNVSKLKSADIIIELHPFVASGVEEYLVNLFCLTHELSFVSSQDNHRKIFDFNSSLSGLNPLEKLKSVEEGRIFTMDWLIAQAKSC
jgi:hypothetical protein